MWKTRAAAMRAWCHPGPCPTWWQGVVVGRAGGFLCTLGQGGRRSTLPLYFQKGFAVTDQSATLQHREEDPDASQHNTTEARARHSGAS
jgi:hypothetical protein